MTDEELIAAVEKRIRAIRAVRDAGLCGATNETRICILPAGHPPPCGLSDDEAVMSPEEMRAEGYDLPDPPEFQLRLGMRFEMPEPDPIDAPPATPLPTLDAAVSGFLAEAVIPDKASFTSTAELVAASRQWCDEKGAYRFGARALAKQLRRIGALKAKSTSGMTRGWRGVRLR